METTIQVNGKDVKITLTKEQVDAIKRNSNPMTEVYAFHNTTEEEFIKLYANVSDFAKHQEVERMIVNFYNKGEVPDFNNKNQVKYTPYFNLGDSFSYHDYDDWFTTSDSSARLCFLRLEDLKDAVVKFIEQYRNSRNG